MDAVLYGSVLSGKSKGIESHGMKDVIAVHLLESGHHVSDGIVPDVTHVEFSRRIREHLEAIEFFAFGIVGGLKDFFFFPDLLPFLFYFCEFVTFFHNLMPRSALSGSLPRSFQCYTFLSSQE